MEKNNIGNHATCPQNSEHLQFLKQTACRPASPKMFLAHHGGARKKKKNKKKHYLQSENNYRRIVIIHIIKAIELVSAVTMGGCHINCTREVVQAVCECLTRSVWEADPRGSKGGRLMGKQ